MERNSTRSRLLELPPTWVPFLPPPLRQGWASGTLPLKYNHLCYQDCEEQKLKRDGKSKLEKRLLG